MTTQSLFSNLNAQPAPYNPQALLPNPQAGQNALASALAQQKKRQQDASLAASALARKSHPQTLGQPSKSNASPQQGQPGIGPTPPQAGVNAPIQRQPDPGLPRAVGGSAPPPPGQLGAAQAGGPTPALGLPEQIKAIQAQIVTAQQSEAQAQQALKDAMAQPQPTMPTYTAPTMQAQNPGMAIGAALAALFAPKYSQGAIGALGVDQANREKAYDQATTAAKDKWNAGISSYEDAAKRRQEGIENADKLGAAAGRRLTGLDTALNTDIYREGLETEAEERLKEKQAEAAETKRNHDLIQGRFMDNAAMRREFHQDLITHYGQVLGLREEQINVQRGRLSLGADNLRWQMKKFGASEEQAARINGMRMATALVIEKSRESSAADRATNSANMRAVLQGQHDFNMLQQAFIRNPNPDTAKKLADYYSSPQGQRLNTALKQFGVSGEMATDLLDQETTGATTSTDAAGNVVSETPVSPGAPPVIVNNNFGAPAVGTAAPGAAPAVASPAAPTSAQDMLRQAQALAPGITASITGQPQPTATPTPHPTATPHPTPTPHPVDPVVAQFQKDLPQAKSLWPQYLARHNGNPTAAWTEFSQFFGKSDPREVSMIRHELIAGGAQKKTVPVPVPVRPKPTSSPAPRALAPATPPPPNSPSSLRWGDLF